MQIIPIGFSAVALAGETSCFLLESDNESILLDVGTNPAASLSRFGKSTIDLSAVYISHVHADHMQGFPSLVFTRSVQSRTATHEVGPLVVLAAPPVLEAAQALLQLLYPEREFPVTWVSMQPAEQSSVGPLSLEAFEVDHAVPSFGLVISRQGDKLCSYSSDTAFCDSLVDHCAGSRALIVECFGLDADFGEMAKSAKHMCSSDAARVASAVRPVVAIPYHMHAPYRNPDTQSLLRQDLSTKYAGRWEYPIEGQAITVQ